MITYEITYIKTGSGEIKKFDKVWISTCDKKSNGLPVSNIVEAMDYFEELAANWGTYENKNAIINIKAIEIK